MAVEPKVAVAAGAWAVEATRKNAGFAIGIVTRTGGDGGGTESGSVARLRPGENGTLRAIEPGRLRIARTEWQRRNSRRQCMD